MRWCHYLSRVHADEQSHGDGGSQAAVEMEMIMTTQTSAAVFERNCKDADIHCVIGEQMKILKYVTIWSQNQ